MSARLVLASTSPRRKELLGRLVKEFEICDSQVDESWWESTDPRSIAEELSLRKALSVATGTRQGVVLAADTVIDLDGALVGKPADEEDAFDILCLLRGRVHRVITGLALVDASGNPRPARSVVTRVWMRPYSDREIREYIATGEPMDKAGAYGIQGAGGALIGSFEGCFNNVIGLPLCAVSTCLESVGVPLAPGLPCSLDSGKPCPRLLPSEGESRTGP